ncbi:hypothetical protein QR680_012837 [Steinernema hermaphroditum]|uniref:adenylyl-sulfate kinase n=1 Tax=Steinernema hermaphroditum TaxID=289476 RepID=A0AA39M185_9BILA|nr:hypothetical protein QR680_012837 [Steinernema hermaphroditum]
MLVEMGVPVYGLDGDNVRHGLCRNLSFHKEDREENVRRVAEVAKLFADMGVVCLASFISPYASGRHEARLIHNRANLRFFEVFVDASLEVCEWRDTKSLYKKARAGQICGFTGVDSVYEEPRHADLTLRAGDESVEESTRRLITFLFEKGVIPHLPYCSPSATLPMQMPSSTTLSVSEEEAKWIQVLANGWIDPLRGLMTEKQHLQCLQFGVVFDPLPTAIRTPLAVKVTSPVDPNLLVALAFEHRVVATVPKPEVYRVGTDIFLGGNFVITSCTNPLLRSPYELRRELASAKPDVIAAIFLNSAVDNTQAVRIDESRELLARRGYGSALVAVFVTDEAEFLRSEGVADPETTKVVLFPFDVDDALLKARLMKAIGARVLLVEERTPIRAEEIRVAPGLEDVEVSSRTASCSCRFCRNQGLSERHSEYSNGLSTIRRRADDGWRLQLHGGRRGFGETDLKPGDSESGMEIDSDEEESASTCNTKRSQGRIEKDQLCMCGLDQFEKRNGQVPPPRAS